MATVEQLKSNFFNLNDATGEHIGALEDNGPGKIAIIDTQELPVQKAYPELEKDKKYIIIDEKKPIQINDDPVVEVNLESGEAQLLFETPNKKQLKIAIGKNSVLDSSIPIEIQKNELLTDATVFDPEKRGPLKNLLNRLENCITHVGQKIPDVAEFVSRPIDRNLWNNRDFDSITTNSKFESKEDRDNLLKVATTPDRDRFLHVEQRKIDIAMFRLIDESEITINGTNVIKDADGNQEKITFDTIIDKETPYVEKARAIREQLRAFNKGGIDLEFDNQNINTSELNSVSLLRATGGSLFHADKDIRFLENANMVNSSAIGTCDASGEFRQIVGADEGLDSKIDKLKEWLANSKELRLEIPMKNEDTKIVPLPRIMDNSDLTYLIKNYKSISSNEPINIYNIELKPSQNTDS